MQAGRLWTCSSTHPSSLGTHFLRSHPFHLTSPANLLAPFSSSSLHHIYDYSHNTTCLSNPLYLRIITASLQSREGKALPLTRDCLRGRLMSILIFGQRRTASVLLRPSKSRVIRFSHTDLICRAAAASTVRPHVPAAPTNDRLEGLTAADANLTDFDTPIDILVDYHRPDTLLPSGEVPPYELASTIRNTRVLFEQATIWRVWSMDRVRNEPGFRLGLFLYDYIDGWATPPLRLYIGFTGRAQYPVLDRLSPHPVE